jgi:hypothetical protein
MRPAGNPVLDAGEILDGVLQRVALRCRDRWPLIPVLVSVPTTARKCALSARRDAEVWCVAKAKHHEPYRVDAFRIMTNVVIYYCGGRFSERLFSRVVVEGTIRFLCLRKVNRNERAIRY